jgi:uncharacterized protein YqhQ
MRGRWTGEQNWVTFIILFVILLILVGFRYPHEVRMIPFVVGFPTLFLLLLLWLGGLHSGFKVRVDTILGEQGDKKSAEKRGKGSEFTGWTSVLIIMAWVLLFFLLVFVLGFALVCPIFITCFLIRKAGLKWPTAVLSALIAIVLIYIFMEGVIQADLWCGAIPEIIPGIMGGSIIPPL